MIDTLGTFSMQMLEEEEVRNSIGGASFSFLMNYLAGGYSFTQFVDAVGK